MLGSKNNYLEIGLIPDLIWLKWNNPMVNIKGRSLSNCRKTKECCLIETLYSQTLLDSANKNTRFYQIHVKRNWEQCMYFHCVKEMSRRSHSKTYVTNCIHNKATQVQHVLTFRLINYCVLDDTNKVLTLSARVTLGQITIVKKCVALKFLNECLSNGLH